MSQLPYLEGDVRAMFDAWAERMRARHAAALTFAELRKGVQALGVLDEPADFGGETSRRLLEGRGKRAALATFRAQLSFLTVHHAALMLDLGRWAPVRRVIDLGAGTGGAGAALSLALGGARVEPVDRSGWALERAVETARAFGLAARPRRGELPEAVGRPGRGDVLLAAWIFRELDPPVRAGLRAALVAALRRGARVAVLEMPGVPQGWWRRLAAAFEPFGVREELIRVAIDRPPLIREIDRAARLDHQVLGARVLYGPEDSSR
ncbi:MAG: hypothetical protein Kow0062_15200 [Acidobacteriota bacterium]